MNNKFLEETFSLIHHTSEDMWSPCKVCGDHKEIYVCGVLKGKKTQSYYSYPDLKPRRASVCSKCYKPPKSKEKRVCSIHVYNCEECQTVSVAKTKKSKFCSVKCSQKFHNRKKTRPHDLKCQQCSKRFYSSHKHKFCSEECKKEHKHLKYIESNTKNCKNCGTSFVGKSNSKYCSVKCRVESNLPKKKERSCLRCNNPVKHPKKVCETCKSRKPNRTKKEKPKGNCEGCGRDMQIKHKNHKYCKPTCSNSHKEYKKLRKRTKRKAKLNIESNLDIYEFKKSRPKNKQLDHIIPLNHSDVCGLHNTWNFQWLSPEDNVAKSNKFDGTMDNNSWKLD